MDYSISTISSLISANDFSAALWNDGTVSVFGKAVEIGRISRKEIEALEHVSMIAAGENSGIAAVTDEGHVLLAGIKQYANWRQRVSQWNDIVSVAIGDHCVIGIDKSGHVHVVGDDETPSLERWDHIISVNVYGTFVIGVKSDGTVITSAYHQRNYWLDEIAGWKDITQVAIGSQFSVAGSTVFVAGLQKDGRVVCSAKYPVFEKEIEAWQDIVCLCAGLRFSLLGLRKDGTISVYQSQQGDRKTQFDMLSQIHRITAGEDYVVVQSEDRLMTIGTDNLSDDRISRPSVAQKRTALREKKAKRGRITSYVAGGLAIIIILMIYITGVFAGYEVRTPSGTLIAGASSFFSGIVAIAAAVVICFSWPDRAVSKKGKIR